MRGKGDARRILEKNCSLLEMGGEGRQCQKDVGSQIRREFKEKGQGKMKKDR